MNSYSSEHIRNVLFAGHGGTGKTTLSESLLYLSGVLDRPGRVEDGNTVFDFEEEEKQKQLSISLAISPMEWKNCKINLMDSPGYTDFIGEVQTGLGVCDTVCFVISAVEGVQVQHEILWELARTAHLPRFIFLNKCDRERASVPRVTAQLVEKFGVGITPLQIPLGAEKDFRGLIGLLDNLAWEYKNGIPKEVAIPPELREHTADLRQQAVETIVENDEELLERYFADEDIEGGPLFHALRTGITRAETFPVIYGAATELIGIDRLAHLITKSTPSPLAHSPFRETRKKSEDRFPLENARERAPTLYIFKTITDPFVGQINYFRVAAGNIKKDDHLYNLRCTKDERLHQLFIPFGKDQQNAETFAYGDIGAVGKLSGTITGDTLSDPHNPILLAPTAVAKPVYALAISPKTSGDDDKLTTSLQRILLEDASLQIERNAETHQTLLWGMGETHLLTTIDRLRQRFGVEVTTEDPKNPYRETAGSPSDFEGKHKKQSGGHGQFGVAHIRLDPLPRGAGYEFVDQVVGGAIPKQYIPAVDKGVREALAKGPLGSYPIVDIRVTLDNGKAHSVDSDENSFRMAGKLALQGAIDKASPVLLEPICTLEVLVPNEFAGDISGDVSARRGHIQGMENLGDRKTLIKALVPQAEMHKYAIDLRSKTGGHASFTLEFHHYEKVPAHLVTKILHS